MFKLSGILNHHTSDVRGVASLGNEYLATVSRDKTSCLWAREESSKFEISKVLLAHNGYVNSVTFLNYQNKDFVITGGSDKLIHVWDISEPSTPAYTLTGHTENVCALGVLENRGFISGSWDKTAKVWIGFKSEFTLTGHTSAVWAVLELKDKSILTGSADKTIRRWNNGKLVQTYLGHEDCVRALVLNPDGTFTSASNDGSIRVWDTNGECLRQFYGHESFVYSLASLPTGEIVSSSEDRTVRVWKEGNNAQTIILPATSIWCVCTMSNGDIACGTSDGKAYIFSRDQSRVADPEVMRVFNEMNANFAESKKTKESLNTENLPGPERLLQPGTKDQQVIMIKDGTAVYAHQWNLSSNTWVKVGVVTDAVGQERKQLLEGKEYDYVFSVDLEDGKPVKKLPFNATENPYDAAQKFINKYELSQTYLDEIVQFIIQNTEGVQFGSNETNSDPLTGRGRYIPSAKTENKPIKEKPKFHGIGNYTMMTTGNPKAIFTKLTEFNSNVCAEQPEVALNSQELEYIHRISITLENPSNGLGKLATGFAELRKALTEWPLKYRFPCLDLLRLIVVRNLGAHILNDLIFGGYRLDLFIEQAAQLSDLASENSPMSSEVQVRSTMVMRMLANLLTFDAGQKEVVNSMEGLLELSNQMQTKNPTKNLTLAISSFYINFAVFARRFASDLAMQSKEEFLNDRIDGASFLIFESASSWIGTLVKNKQKSGLAEYDQLESDTLNRLLSVVGEFILINKQKYVELANSGNLLALIKGLSSGTASSELSRTSESVLGLIE